MSAGRQPSGNAVPYNKGQLGRCCNGAMFIGNPGVLQDLGFPKKRQCALLCCTFISTVQGQTLTRVPVSPLCRRKEAEGTQRMCPSTVKLLDLH